MQSTVFRIFSLAISILSSVILNTGGISSPFSLYLQNFPDAYEPIMSDTLANIVVIGTIADIKPCVFSTAVFWIFCIFGSLAMSIIIPNMLVTILVIFSVALGITLSKLIGVHPIGFPFSSHLFGILTPSP